MAHLFESGLFFGQNAWHGLGVTLPENSPVRRNVGEAIEAADMNWNVGLEPVLDARGRVIEGHKAVVRDRDGRVLGVVKNRFRTLQNRDIFDWFQPFLDSGQCQFETCGSLKDGAVVWVLAALQGELSVTATDKIKKYLLLSSSHDGSLATRVGFCPIRVVCWNTLSAGIRDRESSLLRIRHTERQKIALAQVRDIINLANQTFEATVEQCRKLATCKVSRADIREYVRLVFELSDDEKISTRSANNLNEIVQLTEKGVGNEGATAWDAYNGVTQYLTHHASRTAATRLESNWFGPNKARTDRALRLALQLAV